MRKILLLAVLFGLVVPASAQVTFSGIGDWEDPANWDCTCVPSAASGPIIIDYFSIVYINSSVTADEMIVLGDSEVHVENGGVLTILDGTGDDLTLETFDLVNSATDAIININNGGRIRNAGQIALHGANASSKRAQFRVNDGGEYVHIQNGNSIPRVTWESGSICRIRGILNPAGQALTDFRSSLSQQFHHFIWDCQNQTAANFSFEGALDSVHGNFIVRSTNFPGRRITMGYSSSLTKDSLYIGGNFIAQDSAKVTFNASGDFLLKVKGSFNLQHSSASSNAAYQLNNTGITTVNIDGDLNISGNGQLQMAGGSGPGTFNIGGNMTITGGTIAKAAGGNATFNFTAGATHTYTASGGTLDNVAINYSLGSGGTLNLGTSALGTAAGTFTSSGTVVLGSFNNTSGTGALAGNIRCSTRTFSSGTIVYQGVGGGQFIGSDHPTSTNVNTTINNSNGVTLVANTTIGGNLTLQSGNIIVSSFRLTLGSGPDGGNITAGSNRIEVAAGSRLVFNGSGALGTLPLTGTDITDFTLNRSTSGSAALGSSLTISGTFTQTAGRLDIGSNTLTIGGAYTGTGNLGTTASSILVINGSGSLPTISFQPAAINTLTLNRTGTPNTLMTTGGALTATNLNLLNGTFSPGVALFNMASGGIITVENGVLSSTPGGSGTYDVVYTNSSPISGGAEIPSALITNRLNNVTITGGSSVELPHDCTVNGTITITSGSLDTQNHNVTLLGNFIGNSGGTLTGSTFTFDGNTTISGSSVPDFGSIILNGSRTLSLPATINVAGNIQLAAGATFNHNNGTITLNGSVDQTISGGGLTMNNLFVNKTNSTDVTLTSALNLLGTLDIQSANTVFHSDGFLRLRSTTDAASGNARVAPLTAAGSSVDGDVIVERYMSPEGRVYRHISSPVSGHTVAAIQAQGIAVTGTFTGASTGCTGCTSNPSMHTYNVNTSAFVQFPVSANTEAMDPGAGYLLFIRQNLIGNSTPVTINYTGPINQGDFPATLVHNGTPESWNLVGNPYPSSIDWDIISGWTKTNVAGTVAVQDSPAGGYRYWNGSVGSGISSGLENGEIAKGQAFWVRTTGASPTPQLILHEQAKIANPAPFYRESAPDPDVLTINVTDTRGLADRAAIQLHQDATTALDDLDAPKLTNTWLDLSTRIGNSPARFAINAIDKITCETPIAIDMKFIKTAAGPFVITPTGSYKFKFGLQGSKWAGRTVKMIDNYTGTVTDITDGQEYSFAITEGTPASFASDRFSLQFGDQDPALDLAVTGDATTCINGQVSMTLASTQPGFRYYVANGSTPISEERDGNGSELLFTVSADQLAAGSNNLSVVVKGICSSKTLNSSWGVTKQQMAKPVSADSQSCGAGKVSLTATGGASGDTYQWYESIDSQNTIGTEAIFVTPVLEQSKTYYVSVRSQHGCESDRAAVTANVVNVNSASIAVNGATLTSNYDSGNQWSFNDEPIEGATGKTLTATETGTYTLTVSSNGCTTTATTNYAVTGDIDNGVTGVRAYPNPVTDNLYIDFGTVSGPVEITLQNELGGSVKNLSLQGGGSTSISMRDFAAGIYFVRVAGGGTVRTLKVVKVSR